MGYSHYFTKECNPTIDQWEAITSDFNKLLTEVRAKYFLTSRPLPPIQYEDDLPDAVEVNDQRIRFNGVGRDGHETMSIGPASELGFNCCKTADKPYDIWVTALLVLCHHHAPECWRINSDGESEGMLAGLAVVRHLHPDAENPIHGWED